VPVAKITLIQNVFLIDFFPKQILLTCVQRPKVATNESFNPMLFR